MKEFENFELIAAQSPSDRQAKYRVFSWHVAVLPPAGVISLFLPDFVNHIVGLSIVLGAVKPPSTAYLAKDGILTLPVSSVFHFSYG